MRARYQTRDPHVGVARNAGVAGRRLELVVSEQRLNHPNIRAALEPSIGFVPGETKIAARSKLMLDSGPSRSSKRSCGTYRCSAYENTKISAAYKSRTKYAKSRDLEKEASREGIGSRQGCRSTKLCARKPTLIGDFYLLRADRKYLARCDWRRERNRDPTFSGLWITGGAPLPPGGSAFST
jgi:hypothetical protein